MADIWNKYEPTAARKRGTPGKQSRPKSITVDMHAHVAIPRAGEIAGPHLGPSPLDHFSNAETKALMAKQEADIRDGMRATDAQARTMQTLSPSQIGLTRCLTSRVRSAHATPCSPGASATTKRRGIHDQWCEVHVAPALT